LSDSEAHHLRAMRFTLFSASYKFGLTHRIGVLKHSKIKDIKILIMGFIGKIAQHHQTA
jgi:hypothetical protein